MMKKDLSKVQISKPEENSRTTVKNVRCSVCDEVSKSVLRVCDSGHWARQNFQSDPATPDQETSDSIAGLVQCCSNIMVSRCEVLSLPNKDFASGDHHHCYKCFRQISKSKSLNNIDVNEKTTRGRYSIPEEEGIYKTNKETTIKYKNVNFDDSESLLSISESNNQETTKNNSEKSTDLMHRPITCPISDCRKMIARASILQHFIFDHSKVPRITLNVDELQRVFINVSAITKEVRSYAVFLVQINAPLVHTDSNTLMNGGHKNASFLLMGVRIQTAEIIKKSHGGEWNSIRHTRTQTEAPAKSSKVCLEPKAINDSVVVGGVDKHLGHLPDHQDVILLWICKLVHGVTLYYNISVRRPDRKLGYSFTGETLNIADFFELPMYKQVECLRILGKASIKLMNEQNELEVIVNIFK